MKFIALTALFLLTSLSLSAKTVRLNSKKIDLGKLAQQKSSAMSSTITVVRSKRTPTNVVLKYSYNYLGNVCTWEVEHCTPGNVVCDENVCWSTGSSCSTTCYRWEDRVLTTTKKVQLRFKNATALRGNQKEIFQVSLRQTAWRKTNVLVNAREIDVKKNYKLVNTRTGLGLGHKLIKFIGL